jgi:hypothetical protein
VPANSSSLSAVHDAVRAADVPTQPLDLAASVSLVRALGAVPVPRRRRGRRDSLQSLLLLAVGAVLAGARSYAAIAQWAAEAEHAMTVCGPTPHATTFGRVLARGLFRCAAGGVDRLSARPPQRRRRPRPCWSPVTGEAWQPVAVDGKTLRGARVPTAARCGRGAGESAGPAGPRATPTTGRPLEPAPTSGVAAPAGARGDRHPCGEERRSFAWAVDGVPALEDRFAASMSPWSRPRA